MGTMTTKRNAIGWRGKILNDRKRKEKLETHPIDFSNAIGEYTSNNVLVDIDTEENEINITYKPNEDIVYKFQITVHEMYPFSAPRLHFMTIEEYDKDGKKKIIKKPLQTWNSISPNASETALSFTWKIDALINAWKGSMSSFPTYIPKILDTMLPLL